MNLYSISKSFPMIQHPDINFKLNSQGKESVYISPYCTPFVISRLLSLYAPQEDSHLFSKTPLPPPQ